MYCKNERKKKVLITKYNLVNYSQLDHAFFQFGFSSGFVIILS